MYAIVNIHTRDENVSVVTKTLNQHKNTLDVRLDDIQCVTIFDVPIERARQIAIELLASCDAIDGGFSAIAAGQAIVQQQQEQPEPAKI